MPSNHFILCRPLLLLPPISPSIRVFSNESTLRIRWPKYWSFSFSISPSNEHPGLISFRIDWLDLLAVQGTLKSLLQHHNSKASIFWCSAFFTVQLSHPYMTTGKTIALTRQTFVGKIMSLLLNMLSRLVITFLPRSTCLLISWLQSPSAVILEPRRIKSDTVSTVSPSISHVTQWLLNKNPFNEWSKQMCNLTKPRKKMKNYLETGRPERQVLLVSKHEVIEAWNRREESGLKEKKTWRNLWVGGLRVTKGKRVGVIKNHQIHRDNWVTESRKILITMALLVAQMVKTLLAMWENQDWSLGQKDPMEKDLATHFSILAWRIPWTDEHARLPSMGWQRV